ncbi:hypothetical protein M422DRAFT_189841 [Sphaerobolus stellatus SS14]|uniref:Uncharacterized protein n=1 Tax=Sphaerobolus stellatus (strain SS14) TaxID=990650 RepID=A0A0C9UHA7_SPHS4|nr:hypothetical protein M422DRAFT_189841 [Sphaerobolus stellatus SS14]
MNDTELMMDIMSGVPVEWNTVLTTHLFEKVKDLQRAIKYHEETLIKTGQPIRPLEMTSPRTTPYQSQQTNLVGWSSNLGPPPFPKDDSTVSRGRTPEQKGARPCRHCGSGKHWDNECKHSRKGGRQVRANFVHYTPDDLRAQAAYDDLYYEESATEDEQEIEANEIEGNKDF